MKNRKKGFTLIELLAVIAITSFVFGIVGVSAYKITNNSKDKSEVLAMNNIKKTANLYVEEYKNDVIWTENTDKTSYACIAVKSLINKGYLQEKDIQNGYSDKFISLTRDKNNTIVGESFSDDEKCGTNRKSKVPLPTAKKYCNILVYNGEEQILTKSSDEGFNFNENNFGNLAGNYVVEAKLQEGYVWMDNSKEVKKITCSIEKAKPVLSFSKNNNDNSNGEDGTVLSDTVLNLESNVDGNISIKTSNKDVASASINNNQIKVGVANRVTIKKYAAKSSNTYITFTLTPSDSRNYKTTDIVYTIGKVDRKEIKKPVCKNLYYNGTSQQLVEDNVAYILINNVGKDIESNYKVIAKLNYGYVWADDNTSSDYALNCEVKRPTPTVTYDTNGGSGCKSTVVTYGQNYGNLCTPSRTGYKFLGWFTERYAGDKIESTTLVTNFRNHTIYAHWQVNRYTLTYNSNGGSTCDPANKTVNYNTAYGTLCTPSKTGYKFKGWYTATSGGTAVTKDTKMGAENKTIYAQWEAYQCTINFDADGGKFTGSNAKLERIVKYGWDSYNPESAKHPGIWDANGGSYAAIKTGYSPVSGKEWIRTSDNKTFDQTKDYKATDFCPNLKNGDQTVTLKVNWTKNSYTLTYSSNKGDECHSTKKTVNYNEPYGPLCTPTKTGYKFKGWYTAPSEGEGTAVTKNTKMGAGNKTIYAQWDPYQCTINFEANGGKFTGSNAKLERTVPYEWTSYEADAATHPGIWDANGGSYKAIHSNKNYTIRSGAEWIRLGDGKTFGNKIFDQTKDYKATDFCPNLAKGDQAVTLKVNWYNNVTASFNYNIGDKKNVNNLYVNGEKVNKDTTISCSYSVTTSTSCSITSPAVTFPNNNGKVKDNTRRSLGSLFSYHWVYGSENVNGKTKITLSGDRTYNLSMTANFSGKKFISLNISGGSKNSWVMDSNVFTDGRKDEQRYGFILGDNVANLEDESGSWWIANNGKDTECIWGRGYGIGTLCNPKGNATVSKCNSYKKCDGSTEKCRVPSSKNGYICLNTLTW